MLYQLLHVSIFNIIDKNDTIAPNPNAQKFKLVFDEVTGTNCRFKLIDSTVKWDQAGFNPFDQDFYGINIQANHFKIIEDSLHFYLKELTGFEKCGLKIKKMACKAIISPTIMEFANLDLQLNKSKIKDYACMKFENYDSLANNFISNVKLIANLKQSYIHISDIAFFTSSASLSNTRKNNTQSHDGSIFPIISSTSLKLVFRYIANTLK